MKKIIEKMCKRFIKKTQKAKPAVFEFLKNSAAIDKILTKKFKNKKVEMQQNKTEGTFFVVLQLLRSELGQRSTLVYRIVVHARLLILRKKSTLHGLIWVCTFIDFEKTFPPARLFHPARLLVSTINFSLL